MTRLIPIDSITVAPNRQRRDFDPEALQDLITSIQESEHGLLHPIVVRLEAGQSVLVAGERRLRAIREINELGGSFRHGGSLVNAGQIPVVDLGELEPLAAFEAELEENIRRKDLTVLEAAQATSNLFELRSRQAQAKGAPAVTPSDIAREVFDIPPSKPAGELGSARSTVRDQLLVAKHSANPDVRKATSLKEAVNIIKKADNAAQAIRLAEVVGKTYSTKNLTLLNADFLEWAPAATPGLYNIILTDPPYGMDAQDFNDSGKPGQAGGHTYDDSYENWQRIMSAFCPASFALASASAHAYVFCDIDRFSELRERMAKAGWTVHRTPLVWHNPDGFRAPWPSRGPQRKYELILYAVKGDKQTVKLMGDVLTYRKDSAVGHPAQKPVDLLKDLLSRSALPGDTVADFFAGSGGTLEACHSMKLDCLALEKDPAHYGTALKRVKALSVNDEGLF